MEQFVVTAKLGESYYDSVIVEVGDIYYAINAGCEALNCCAIDIVSIVKVSYHRFKTIP